MSCKTLRLEATVRVRVRVNLRVTVRAFSSSSMAPRGCAPEEERSVGGTDGWNDLFEHE